MLKLTTKNMMAIVLDVIFVGAMIHRIAEIYYIKLFSATDSDTTVINKK